MCIWISLYLICVRDSKGRVCAFLTWYVCVCVCVSPCQGKCRGSQCVVTAEEEESAFVCGREQMPAMQRGVPAHFDCSVRTDRWAGGAQVGVSVGCGGLWVMPDFSALYAPHAFILHMLQTNATLHQLLCSCEPKVFCVFKKPNLFNIHFTVWAGLNSNKPCTNAALKLCANEQAQLVYERPLTYYQICLAVIRVRTTKLLCMCVCMHGKTAPDNIVILCGVPE